MAMQILYAGINHSIPGDGGPVCFANSGSYISRLVETLVALCIAYVEFKYANSKLNEQLPWNNDEKCGEIPCGDNQQNLNVKEISVSPKKSKLFSRIECQRRLQIIEDGRNLTLTRRCLAAFLCLIFGAQLGYKLVSKTCIYFLNPCHVTTVIQIVLLLSNPYRNDKFTTFLFRVHLYVLSGATIALIFPVLNTLLLPHEVTFYYVQHIAIILMPFYMLTHGGSFSVEEWNDFSWVLLSTAIIIIYHFVVLQFLALLTLANLSNMLCAAVSDPFGEPYYRIWGIGHQSLLIPLQGKFYALCSNFLLKYLGDRSPKTD
uniref:Transmembrane protein 164 n=1 Tax=Romanomermis culicivorax TaxID=13658 RepID=A0A915J8X6_ROMCU